MATKNSHVSKCHASKYLRPCTKYIRAKYLIEAFFKSIFEVKKKDYFILFYVLVRTFKEPPFNCNISMFITVNLNHFINNFVTFKRPYGDPQ